MRSPGRREPLLGLLALGLVHCVRTGAPADDASPSPDPGPGASEETAEPQGETASPQRADVRGVEVSGSPGAYRFAVTVRSPDEGCDRYADWWEVLSASGALLYRRILMHSHVNEQPFTRTGEPVPVQEDDEVVVRAHLHPDGYGGRVLRGTAGAGFEVVELDPGFAPGVGEAPPQPSGCLY